MVSILEVTREEFVRDMWGLLEACISEIRKSDYMIALALEYDGNTMGYEKGVFTLVVKHPDPLIRMSLCLGSNFEVCRGYLSRSFCGYFDHTFDFKLILDTEEV